MSISLCTATIMQLKMHLPNVLFTLPHFYIDAPVFSAGNTTQEVTPGENVTLLCSADANPAPEIQWNFPPEVNVVNTTGWRHSAIQVREATSTNAGVYMCVATNKVGRVTRYVALVMKGSI